jgi:CubicO group peptidase (beta-lactamase class C family)
MCRNDRGIALLLSGILLIAAPLSAAAQIPAVPRSDGLSVRTIAPLFEAFSTTAPGCAVGVAVADGTAITAAYGSADLEHPRPLTPTTIFESGSVAKQFTAAAMQLLAQQGKLSLEDDIRRYLPQIPDYGTPITLRHLLTHTSGIREQWSLMALSGNSPGSQTHSMAMILDLASRQRALNFEPGAEFLYTNTNYSLAAIIVERVSGKTLQQFMQQHFFTPLGMGHTQWREDFRTVVLDRATAYAPTATGFIANMPFTNVYGNGGLLTTIGDLLRWNAFLENPTTLPGGPELVAALYTPGRLRHGAQLNYGLGVEVGGMSGQRLMSHGGSTGGYKTWLARYPDQKLSVALLCNNGGVNPVELGEAIAARALLAIGRAKVTVAASPSRASTIAKPVSVDLTRYTGLFRNPTTGALAQLSVASRQLSLTSDATSLLTPIGREQFQGPNRELVQFIRQTSAPIEFILRNGGEPERYVAVQSSARDSITLAAYVGSYYSVELDTRITVVQQRDTLVMRQPFAIEWLLEPSFADGFTTRLRGTTTFLFSRSQTGQVDGFGAWANGARNVRFIKQ